MTAPGNNILQIVLALAFVIASGYASGRIHQWYKHGLERDQAYREGYNHASRSMFDLAIRSRAGRPAAAAAPPASSAPLAATAPLAAAATAPLAAAAAATAPLAAAAAAAAPRMPAPRTGATPVGAARRRIFAGSAAGNGKRRRAA